MYRKIMGIIVKNIYINASTVQILIITVLWFIFLFHIYCENRQYKLLKNAASLNTIRIETIANDTVNKINYSSNFNLEQLQYSMLSSVYAVILSTVEIYFGFYYQYWTMAEKLSPFNNEIIHNCVWFHILYTIYSLCDTPYSVYENSVNNPTVDRNNRARPFFFSGNLISYAFVQILGIFFCTIFIILARDCGNYYVFISIWLILILIYLTCYNFNSPLLMKNFNTHVPLPKGTLRSGIETLCRQLAFPLKEIFVIDQINWFGYKNIEMIGVTKEKYIVINEILLPKKRQIDDILLGYPHLKTDNSINDESDQKGLLDNDEILAITAHELGHWYRNHFYKLFTALILYYVVMFLLFALTYQREIIFLAFGFPQNVKPILAGLFSILSYVITPYNMLANFLINIYSQNLEYEADEFSFHLGYTKKLRSALIKMYSDKVVFPKMDPFYSKWKLDQPTLPERLRALEGLEKNIKTDMNLIINEHIKKGLECLNNVENIIFEQIDKREIKKEPKKIDNISKSPSIAGSSKEPPSSDSTETSLIKSSLKVSCKDNFSLVPTKNFLPKPENAVVLPSNLNTIPILHKSRLKWPKESCLDKINVKLKSFNLIDNIKSNNEGKKSIERPKTCHQIRRKSNFDDDNEIKRPSTSHSTKYESKYKYVSLIPIRQTCKKHNQQSDKSKFVKNFHRFCDDQG